MPCQDAGQIEVLLDALSLQKPGSLILVWTLLAGDGPVPGSQPATEKG